MSTNGPANGGKYIWEPSPVYSHPDLPDWVPEWDACEMTGPYICGDIGCMDPDANNYNPEATQPGPTPFSDEVQCNYFGDVPLWQQNLVKWGGQAWEGNFESACEYIGGTTQGDLSIAPDDPEYFFLNCCPGTDAISQGGGEGPGKTWDENAPCTDCTGFQVKRCMSPEYMQILGAESRNTYHPQLYAALKRDGVSGLNPAGELIYNLGLQTRRLIPLPAVLPAVTNPKSGKEYMYWVSFEGYLILGLLAYGIYLANKKGLFK